MVHDWFTLALFVREPERHRGAARSAFGKAARAFTPVSSDRRTQLELN
jgi:hypothetical protein